MELQEGQDQFFIWGTEDSPYVIANADSTVLKMSDVALDRLTREAPLLRRRSCKPRPKPSPPGSGPTTNASTGSPGNFKPVPDSYFSAATESGVV